jgi:hypothetical protein
MTKQILTMAAALAFTALAPAQSHAQQVTQANVPFAFQVGNTSMPAGEYRIQRALPSNTALQLIRRTDSSASTSAFTNITESRDKNAQSKLIFNCYSNECFLSEIWTGNGQGMKLAVPRREKELSRGSSENELAVVSLPLTVTP